MSAITRNEAILLRELSNLAAKTGGNEIKILASDLDQSLGFKRGETRDLLFGLRENGKIDIVHATGVGFCVIKVLDPIVELKFQ